jgi:hypothetical protein
MQRNFLSGSAICIAIVSCFWLAGVWPSALGRLGVKLLLGGGLLVPVTGAILAVLGFPAAGRRKSWAVALAAVNVVYCAAYWVYVLR